MKIITDITILLILFSLTIWLHMTLPRQTYKTENNAPDVGEKEYCTMVSWERVECYP